MIFPSGVGLIAETKMNFKGGEGRFSTDAETVNAKGAHAACDAQVLISSNLEAMAVGQVP
jgi:hypothetical protein